MRQQKSGIGINVFHTKGAKSPLLSTGRIIPSVSMIATYFLIEDSDMDTILCRINDKVFCCLQHASKSSTWGLDSC